MTVHTIFSTIRDMSIAFSFEWFDTEDESISKRMICLTTNHGSASRPERRQSIGITSAGYKRTGML